jgi:hypothetical protein
MKCPKCGYNSFEHLSACKKCKADLSGFKDSHGIRPVVLPASLQTAVPAPASVPEQNEQLEDMFSSTGAASAFGTIAGSDVTDAAVNNDFAFSFDDAPSPAAEEENNVPAFGDFSFDEIPEPTPADSNGTLTSFAGILETAEREAAQPDADAAPDFSTGFTGFGEPAAPLSPPGEFEMEELFGEEGKETAANLTAPVDHDAFDALFGEEEVPDDKKP